MRIPQDLNELLTPEEYERMIFEQWENLREVVDKYDYKSAVRILNEIFDLKLALELKSKK